MKLNPEPFEKIKSHKKIWEVRLNDDKRKGIHIGDRILFKKQPELLEGVLAKVVDIKHFNSFEEMSEVLSLTSVGFEPGATKQDCVDCYSEKTEGKKNDRSGLTGWKSKSILRR